MRMLFLCLISLFAQAQTQPLQTQWRIRAVGTEPWLSATVPGTVQTDLLKLGLIQDPFYGDQERNADWVAQRDWEYQTEIEVPRLEEIAKQSGSTNKHEQTKIWLVFDGIDTYATLYWNDKPVLKTNNMFRRWKVALNPGEKGTLRVVLHSTKSITDSLAKANLPLVIPDHPRVYARKAPYHFGWDWGPSLLPTGIWKDVYWQWGEMPPNPNRAPDIKLVRKPDAYGESFEFQLKGQRIFMKGANWIPADVFLPRLQRADYERMLKQAKEAGVNMLRVWGGGIYEHNDFYELCDQYGIYVWQDFMFAGGMIPTDPAFLQNVKQEVIEQVQRLRKYRCIVLWCGNNEIDEAWHQWGWKKSFEKDSVHGKQLWDAYTRLFRDSIAQWVKEQDGIRPYVSSSPQYGWGNENSYRSGDSHYWGLWWGLKPVSVFAEKTGRFVSEYGMQAMPDIHTSRSSIPVDQRYLFSPALRAHQKHPTGFETLQHYLHLYVLDSSLVKKLSLHDYTYLTQCLQSYVLQQAIAYHLQAPQNSGTLVWQWNDCWPVCSWSVTDSERRPKAGWYALKRAYTASRAPKPDPTLPRDWPLQPAKYTIRRIGSDTLEIKAINRIAFMYGFGTESYLALVDNYFHLEAGETKRLKLSRQALQAHQAGQLKWKTYNDFQVQNRQNVQINGN